MALTKISRSLLDTGISDSSDATAITIDSSENVGVGTGSPSQKLHVASGFIHCDAGFGLTWDNTHERIEQSDAKLEFFTNNSQAMTLSGGNLGIGTDSPSATLHLSNAGPSIKLEDTDNNSDYEIKNGNGTFRIIDTTNSTDRLNILSSGNVGIGTTTPTNTLDLGSATGGRALTFAKYTNLFSEYSNASGWLSSNFYGNAGASGYKTSATGNFGAAGIRVHGTGGSGNSGIIEFHTDTNASKTADDAFTPTKIMRMDNDGLKFGSDTAAANALDDYEEGTWTPTSGVTLTITEPCRYVKVGKQITLTFDVTFATSSSGSTAVISNMPFSLTTYNTGVINWTNAGTGIMIHCTGVQGSLYNSGTGAVQSYASVSGKRVIGTIIGIVA